VYEYITEHSFLFARALRAVHIVRSGREAQIQTERLSESLGASGSATRSS